MGPKTPRPEDQASEQPYPAEPWAPRQDTDLHRPFLVTGRGVYMGPVGPPEKGRVPRPPSAAMPAVTLEDGGPRRASATSSSAERSARVPQIVEVRPRREPLIEVYLHDKEESLLPIWMTSNEERPASEDTQGTGKTVSRPPSTGPPVPPVSPVSPMEDNPQRLSLPTGNTPCPASACPPSAKDRAAPQIRAAAHIYVFKEGSVGRGASVTTDSTSWKPDVPRSQAAVLEAAKSKLLSEMRARRTAGPDKKGRGPDPAVSASNVDPSFDGRPVGLQSARTKSAVDQGQLSKAASALTSRVQRTASALAAGGQAGGNLAANRYAAAKETKPSKGKVYASITKLTTPLDAGPKRVEVKKTPRFDLSPSKAAALCAVGPQSSAADTNPCQATSCSRIVNLPVSPPKVVCLHTGLVRARGNLSQCVCLLGPPVVTSMARVTTSPLGAQGPATRVLPASSNLMAKGANVLVDDSTRKIVFARGNQDAFALTATTPTFHVPREESQVFPKLAESEDERPVPHTRPPVSLVSSGTAQVRRGELLASEDPSHGGSHRPSQHTSGLSKFSSTPGKFPKLGRRHWRR